MWSLCFWVDTCDTFKSHRICYGRIGEKWERVVFYLAFDTCHLTESRIPHPSANHQRVSVCSPILITNDFEDRPSLSMSYLGREMFSISIVSPHCRIESTLSTLSVLLSIWPKHIDINSSADQSGPLAISWVKLQASRCLKSSFAPNIDMIIQWLWAESLE